MLPNISRSKSNQTMKFRHIIENKRRNNCIRPENASLMDGHLEYLKKIQKIRTLTRIELRNRDPC